jgi:hypothetical protein
MTKSSLVIHRLQYGGASKGPPHLRDQTRSSTGLKASLPGAGNPTPGRTLPRSMGQPRRNALVLGPSGLRSHKAKCPDSSSRHPSPFERVTARSPSKPPSFSTGIRERALASRPRYQRPRGTSCREANCGARQQVPQTKAQGQG